MACTLFAQHSVSGATVNIDAPLPNADGQLTADDVNKVIAGAVGYLQSVNLSGVIAVVNHEGHILAIYRMTQSSGQDVRINEQATAKARTAAYFQSTQNAFSTRTAQFIVQAHFPPGIKNVDAGPLFGVPFSNFPGSDVQLQVPPFIVFVNGVNAPGPAAAPAGNSDFRPLLQPLVITPLTDDPGGLPLYKGKAPAGGIGVEIDGFGVLGDGVADAGVKKAAAGSSKQLDEEKAALAGQVGFAPPRGILGSNILINGFRFKYQLSKVPKSTPAAVSALATLGIFEPYFDTDGTERSASGAPLAGNPYAQTFSPTAVTLTGVRASPAAEFPQQGFVPRFPPRDSPLGLLTATDVRTLIQQAATAASTIRAGIRQPKGVAEQVWISVVDTSGNICGSFRTFDATPFSFDVHVQKARTSAFFSNDQVGFSSRAIGFMAQTTYPPGISNNPPGPISGLQPDKAGVDAGSLGATPPEGAGKLTEIAQLLVDDAGPDVLTLPSVAAQTTLGGKLSATVQDLALRLPHIHDGRISPLQAAITVDLTLGRPSGGVAPPATTIPNGITIFAGGVPIYKAGKLVGGLGVSGGGIDQDDVIALLGQKGYEPPTGVRCDEASEANVVTALQQAVAKLKVQFPNLTNGSTAVLDVISTRLQSGSILEGLRLPYIKEPRAPRR